MFNYEEKELKGLGVRRVYSTPSVVLKGFAQKLKEHLRSKNKVKDFKFENQQRSGVKIMNLLLGNG